MSALAVVEDFDIIENFGTGLAVAGEVSAIDQVEFEGAPKAFHGGVVVAVTCAAHGGHQAGGLQGLPVITTGVLDAAIGVEDQISWRLAVQAGHGQGF